MNRAEHGLIARIHHCAERILAWVATAGVVVLGFAIAMVVTDIIARAALNHSLTGMVDITQLCVMAMAFWSIPYAFIRDGHVGITVATDWLPPRGRALLDALAALAGAIFVGLIGRYGWDQAMLALDYGDSSQTIGIPMTYYWTALLSGSFLSLLATLLNAARRFAEACYGPSIKD